MQPIFAAVVSINTQGSMIRSLSLVKKVTRLKATNSIFLFDTRDDVRLTLEILLLLHTNAKYVYLHVKGRMCLFGRLSSDGIMSK